MAKVYFIPMVSAPASLPWFDVQQRVSLDVAVPAGAPPVSFNGAVLAVPSTPGPVLYSFLVALMGISGGPIGAQCVFYGSVRQIAPGNLSVDSVFTSLQSGGDLGYAAPTTAGNNMTTRGSNSVNAAGFARFVACLSTGLPIS